MSISPKYAPSETESKWYEYWESNGFFRSTPDEREPYTIVIPPPNVTGMLHMGHMLNNTIQDILIRRKRMEGYNACWVPGMDHASIATEAKVVKLLRKQGIKKSDLSREEFLQHAFEWKDKYGGIILKQLRKLGASCDWDRTRFTMDDDYYESVIRVFCDLYEKGHIYRGLRMVNWDPEGRTALSNEEVIYKTKNGKLYHLRYEIEGQPGTYVTIATTRPETILGDTAISVHPKDERYTDLVGKKALVPLIGRAIPIIADEYVDMEFGTGCLKVTPAHDMNDYEIGRRHNLETIDILNEDGTLSEAAQLYIGEDRFVVRKKIAKDLEAAGNLVKTEDYSNSVGHSERTDAIIEPRLSMQWWLKMEDISKPAYKAVEEDVVQLIPPKFKNTYRHWMENIQDWCISRQLWWGQQIPAYFLESERELKEDQRQLFVAVTPEEALEKARTATGLDLSMDDLYRDPDVLDTWFSSWLWPFQVFKGLTEPGNEEVKYYYPTNDLVTGPDILFFWVARMIIAGYEYFDERPFNNVYLTGLIRDRNGKKMSKSLGNSPDPLDLMDLYGADGVRVGVLLSSPAGGDLIFDTPVSPDEELSSKLCEQGRNFCNKVWNGLRLVRGWETSDAPMTELDQLAIDWMEARTRAAKQEIADHFNKFRISDALMTVYKTIWDDFCGPFLETMKPPYQGQISKAAYEKTVDLFEEMMKIAHPFTPFLTEEVWHLLRDRKEGESLMNLQLAAEEVTEADLSMLADFQLIQEAITALRSFRMDKGMKYKDTMDLYINSDQADVFRKYESVMAKALNTGQVAYGEEAPAGSGSVRVRTTEFYVPITNLDVDAEIEKIRKEMDHVQGFLNSVRKKLSNERFVSGAPEAVVALEKKKEADSLAKLKLLEESLASMEALK